jgi:hypothetical protein
MKVNILSNFFVIIGYYRYPLQAHNLIVAVIYNLSNSRDLSAADARAVSRNHCCLLYGIRSFFDQD